MSSVQVSQNGTVRPSAADSTPGMRLRRLQQPLPQCHRLVIGQLGAAHASSGDVQHRIDVVAQPERAHVAEALHEQPRANQQHHRERGLQEQQCRAQPRATLAALARARLERLDQVGAPRTGASAPGR